VPYVRGREVSRPPAAILAEIAECEARGVKELTLLGQNVNSYHGEGEGGGAVDFPALLALIAGRHGATADKHIRWVRFLSSHPKDLSSEAIAVMAANPLFCRHIHLCVQHGSNRILQAMNRKYTRERFLDLVAELRAAIPGISISTDLLVGFPGETEEDVGELLSLMETVRFSESFMYHYNPREGTAAWALGGRIDEEVKIERLTRVIALQKEHTTARLREHLGATAPLLVEGVSRKNAGELLCRTEHDERALIAGDAALTGAFITARLESLTGNTFRAVVI
jgi:tRNA-2-methylthio-N6-dimethylallyladenosine synthase